MVKKISKKINLIVLSLALFSISAHGMEQNSEKVIQSLVNLTHQNSGKIGIAAGALAAGYVGYKYYSPIKQKIGALIRSLHGFGLGNTVNNPAGVPVNVSGLFNYVTVNPGASPGFINVSGLFNSIVVNSGSPNINVRNLFHSVVVNSGSPTINIRGLANSVIVQNGQNREINERGYFKSVISQ